MSRTPIRVTLESSSNRNTASPSQVIDTVAYGSTSSGWKSSKSGSAYSLAQGKTDASANDAGANWCYVTVPYGTAGEFGTPGKANPPCP